MYALNYKTAKQIFLSLLFSNIKFIGYLACMTVLIKEATRKLTNRISIALICLLCIYLHRLRKTIISSRAWFYIL